MKGDASSALSCELATQPLWNNAEDLPVEEQLTMIKPVRQIVKEWMAELDRETQLFLDLSVFSLRQQTSKILRSFTDGLGVVLGGNEQRWAVANGWWTEVVQQIQRIARVRLANTRTRKLDKQYFS